jgi:N-acetyl sugar amidotransferase
MPNTRPNILFKNGVCQGCLYEESKKTINWDARWEELKQFIKDHPTKSSYDCIIAVSGGKDSWFQTYIMKEKLGLNPLLVCVSDNMTVTDAGKHNLENICKEFDCDLFVYKMKPETQKKIMRYTTENYGKPLYIIDRLIYTVPVWVAIKFDIPIVVYGENTSVTRGLKDNRDIPIAWNQMVNGVGSDIPLGEIIDQCKTDPKDIGMAIFPNLEYPINEKQTIFIKDVTTPIYLSYFVKWDAYEHYQFALKRGFRTLQGEWNRWGGYTNYWQIDSYGYMVASDFKFAKLGHSGLTDSTCELIRSGAISKEYGLDMIKTWEGKPDGKAVRDFCKFVGYTENQYYLLLEKIKKGDYIRTK